MTYKSSDYIIDTWKPNSTTESNAQARVICRDNEYFLYVISDDGKFQTEITIKDILYGFQDML